MLTKKPFYFLRHGQTDWNAEGRLQGQTDVPLNVTGIYQADEAKTRLMDTVVATICCSPLGRARQTATIINEAVNGQLVIIDELQECNFGEAEGKPIDGVPFEVLIRRAESYGGETFEFFVERVITGINKSLSYPGPVLIVAHGGVFRAAKSSIGHEYASKLPNCVPMSVTPHGGGDPDWNIDAL